MDQVPPPDQIFLSELESYLSGHPTLKNEPLCKGQSNKVKSSADTRVNGKCQGRWSAIEIRHENGPDVGKDIITKSHRKFWR